MENYDRFEQLLQQYSFKELNAEDQRVVKDFVSSEDEYESLRQASLQLKTHIEEQTEISPGPQVWQRIKNTRAESVAPSTNYFWMKAPMPAYATLLLVVCVGLLGWYGGSNYSSPKVAVKDIQPRVDTVFIASKPDTVVREKIIYVNRQLMPSVVIQASVKDPQDHAARGVNMKEKEELERLLVTGSI